MDLDRIDRTIVAVLQDDGRISNHDLADRIGLSPSACLRRVRRLEDQGVIERYAALVDPGALDLGTTAFVEISLVSQEEGKLDAFEAAVAASPNVMACHLMAGDADYLVEVACDGVTDYERIHRTHLAVLPGVARITSSFSLRTVVSRTAYDVNRGGLELRGED